MADKQQTIWQKLTKVLTFDPNQTAKSVEQSPIIKANSIEELKMKALEQEQQNILAKQWQKNENKLEYKRLQWEAARLPAYIDFEGMEYYPLIASALDLYMEEATTIGDDGQMLHIYSSSERIKNILEDFFYNKIDILVNLPQWTRNLCKYGDNFVHLLPKKGEGIVAVRQMINFDVERYDEKENGKSVVKFKDRETGEVYNTLQVAHFRLLGDDKFLPYGASLLHKIRRTFRQLILAEDAMLTYRLLRAGEKRVFKINVGNMDTADIEAYIQRVATRFKKTPEINRNNGQIDYRFNVIGNDEDYFIPVRGGEGTIIEQMDGGQNLDKINDIGYLRDNLFTGLGIPKPFLGYQESAGEGKNLSMLDIRFAKKVNRIQQALIQELNKMAMIHLYLLGFEEDMNNFTLRLTNPSIQSDLLKIEAWQSKVNLYKDMTDYSNGIAPMSNTKAKKMIFGWSEAEIIDDLYLQRMEQALIGELKNTPSIIPKTGFFDRIDNKYGKLDVGENTPEGENNEGGDQPAEGGGDEAELDLGPAGGGEEPELPEESYKIRKYKKSLSLINEIHKHITDDEKNDIIDIDFIEENDKLLKKSQKYLK